MVESTESHTLVLFKTSLRGLFLLSSGGSSVGTLRLPPNALATIHPTAKPHVRFSGAVL